MKHVFALPRAPRSRSEGTPGRSLLGYTHTRAKLQRLTRAGAQVTETSHARR
jgi:hypothetical protein